MSAERNELDRLAGEYVLGLLSDDERGAFEDELARSSGMRAALRQARERFAELDETAPPLDPSPALWGRIEAGLDQRGASDSNVVPLRRSAPASRFWHGFATAAAAAVLLITIGYGALRHTLAPQPALIVVLLDAQSRPAALVEAFHGQNIRVVPLERLDLPPGKTFQVWTLPSRDSAPVSVGLLEGTSATMLRPELPSPHLDQFYEITIEQAGGSPTNRPTGPIVAKGFARAPQI